MPRALLRNVIALVVVAGGLLAILDGNDHRLHVLPNDASAAGVFPAALIMAAVATLVETTLRRRRAG
jgi:hypothetical protein